jgi:hypothetical protein
MRRSTVLIRRPLQLVFPVNLKMAAKPKKAKMDKIEKKIQFLTDE